jgi:hypothetical protein
MVARVVSGVLDCLVMALFLAMSAGLTCLVWH